LRFVMLVCRDRGPTEGSTASLGRATREWVTEMDENGTRVTGGELAPDDEALAVRTRAGQRHVTEGAFLQTDGVLLGFDVLECRDMAEAIEVVAAHPLASRHVLEIRQVST